MHSWHRRLAVTLATLGLLFAQQAEPVFGSSFLVAPITLTLGPKAPSAVLAVTNQSDELLRFQLSAFAWDQSSDGQPLLTDTADIVFFPSLLSVPPGETFNVRVGTVAHAGASEKTYRIFVEELPNPPSGEAKHRGGVIKILTKFGVPIFLLPDKPAPSASIEDAAVSGGALAFVLRNTGNLHIVPAVVVRGVNAAGATTFQRETAGGYVLGGGTRRYVLDLPKPADCSTTSLLVSVKAGPVSVQETLANHGGPCS